MDPKFLKSRKEKLNFMFKYLPLLARYVLPQESCLSKWYVYLSVYLYDIFTPSLKIFNTGLQIALDIPLCRIIKGQKMSFFETKIWNKFSSNVKTVATTTSFTHHLKKEILSKLQGWVILWIFLIVIYLFSFYFDS